MDRIPLSESDTRANFIDPKLVESQWEAIHIIREYYFTDGRKLLGNKRGKRLFLDYLLKFNNTNLAIIEAKKLDDHPTKGLQQALEYAEKLKINFVYATNGKQIYEFDRRSGKGDYINNFPTPQDLYNRLFGKERFKGTTSTNSVFINRQFWTTLLPRDCGK